MLSVLRFVSFGIHEPVIRSSNYITRTYAFKSDLKIKWVRPEKISCIDPRKSGDKEAVELPNPDEYPISYKGSKELNECSNLVKKMITLESVPGRFTAELVREKMMDKVRRHNYDSESMEAKIAAMTARIRYLQERMKVHPRDRKCKVLLKEMIDRRKKFLKYLRTWDYKRFEWLLEKLNIEYKPPPNEFHWITRKESLTKLTDKYCDDLKAQRLKAYERILKSQQEDFLKNKIATMEHIRKEQIECEVTVTISEQDILNIKKQYEELLEQKKLTK